MLSQQLNQQRQQRKKAMAAGGLADALNANPIGAQIDQDPSRGYYQNRRHGAANSLSDAMAGLNGTRETMGSSAYSAQANSLADNLHNRMASAAALGQRAGSPQGYTDQYNVTTRQGVSTPGPSMGNQAAITAGLARPSGPIARVGLGPDPGGDGVAQPMHAQGVTLGELFSHGDDPARRAAFVASRDKRVARQQGAHDLRRQMMQSQAEASNQLGVANPFQNPFALQAIQRNPQLAFDALNDLNRNAQEVARIRYGNSATMADLSLQERLGMGRNQAASRTADANYLQAESTARRNDAETSLLSDPSVRNDQQSMDAIDMALQSGNPELVQLATDHLRSQFEVPGGSQSTRAQSLNDALAPGSPQGSIQQPALRAVRPDPESGQVPIDAAQNVLQELVSRGYQGERLASEAARLGVSRNVMAEIMDGAPAAPRRFAGGLMDVLGLNPGYQRNLDFYDSLGGVVGRDYNHERRQRDPYNGAANDRFFNVR